MVNIMPASPATAPTRRGTRKKSGLALWMERVLEECDRVGTEFAADPVHDLRVALRRCRSVADGFRAIDPDPSWKQMKKAGKQLFSSLGGLRDAQVMEEWVRKFGADDDPVTHRLLQYLTMGELDLKLQAAEALAKFDHKQWKRWLVSLPRRAARVRTGSAIFKHLALERWTEAHELHRRALRNRSQVAFHSLRIGIKRFRYIVENFLPEQHAAWSSDLKDLQDMLGEVHDFDVLWATALQIKVFSNPESRAHWHSRIMDERARRIETYKSKMVGAGSLWQVWRAELPCGRQIEAAALGRLKLWGSLLDPDVKHSSHVARLALQLYDGLPSNRAREEESKQQRAILQAAALLHDVGRSQKKGDPHKATFRLIQRLTPPLGWTAEAMLIAGAAARYHRGALPGAGQKTLASFTPAERQTIRTLAGILRLANALDTERDGRIKRVKVDQHKALLIVQAEGYSPRDRMAEEIAAGRHLLETIYRRPIMVKAWRPAKTPRVAKSAMRTLLLSA